MLPYPNKTMAAQQYKVTFSDDDAMWKYKTYSYAPATEEISGLFIGALSYTNLSKSNYKPENPQYVYTYGDKYSPRNDNWNKNNLSPGIIIAIVLGCAVGLVLILTIVSKVLHCWCYNKYKKNSSSSSSSSKKKKRNHISEEQLGQQYNQYPPQKQQYNQYPPQYAPPQNGQYPPPPNGQYPPPQNGQYPPQNPYYQTPN